MVSFLGLMINFSKLRIILIRQGEISFRSLVSAKFISEENYNNYGQSFRLSSVIKRHCESFV